MVTHMCYSVLFAGDIDVLFVVLQAEKPLVCMACGGLHAAARSMGSLAGRAVALTTPMMFHSPDSDAKRSDTPCLIHQSLSL